MPALAVDQFIGFLKDADFANARKLLPSIGNLEARTSTGSTLLIAAASVGAVDVVRDILARGADVNARQDNQGRYTALLFALADKNAGLADVLLDHGADPNIATDDGWSPLMFAASNADLIMVKKLVAKGADPDYVGAGGQRAYDILQGCFSIDACLKLIDMNLQLMPTTHAVLPEHAHALQQHVEKLRTQFNAAADTLQQAQAVLKTAQTKTLRR